MNSLKSVISAVATVVVLGVIVGVIYLWQSGKTEPAVQISSPPQQTISSPIVEQEETVIQEKRQPEAANQVTEEPVSDDPEGMDLEGLTRAEMDELLLEAVRSDNLAEIERLLAAGADVNHESSSGYTMLGLAAAKGNTELVNLLISHGAAIDVEDGNSPLVLAVQAEQVAIVKLLLDAGADVNGTISLKGKYENSAGLQWTAAQNNVEIAEILIAHGADVNTIETLYNRTPLHAAAYYNCPEMVIFLLENGADPELRDSFGDTALHYAVSNGVVETARILIDHGVALDTKDNLGRTLLDEAGTNSAIIQLLRDAGIEE